VCVSQCTRLTSSQLRLRLSTLLDKKKVMQQHPQSVSKSSSRYVALEEGLKQFSMDLNKLEVIGPCVYMRLRLTIPSNSSM
jgi:hypothetical protein